MTVTPLRLLCPLVVCFWGCASTPTHFRSDSAANPSAQAAPRYPVATVLGAQDPLLARVCPESGPCVLTNSAVAPPVSTESAHHNHHH